MKINNLLKIAVLGSGALLLLAACGNSSKESKSEEKVLVVGTEGTYAPFSFHDDKDKLTGFDVDVAKAVGKEMGYKVEFFEAPWDSLLAAFDAGKTDVILNQMGITDERKEKYDFSVPYTFSKTALITKKGNQEIKSFDDLKGKKAAQSLTSNYGQVAESYGAELESTSGFDQAIELVLRGRADATLNDDVAYYDYLKQHPKAEIQITATSDDATKIGIPVKKGNADLLKKINQALESLQKDGTLTKISEKYFNEDITKE